MMILTICPFIKIDPLNLESQNPAKNIPVGYDRTNKQRNRQTEITTLYTLRFLVYKNQWRNWEKMNNFQKPTISSTFLSDQGFKGNLCMEGHFIYAYCPFNQFQIIIKLTVPLINFK